MSNQLEFIRKNLLILKKRSKFLQALRHFFNDRDYVEISAPNIVKYVGLEPNIEPFELKVMDENGQEFKAYLQTSPELTMKKVLGAGLNKIYYLGPVFRNKESFGGWHNPEFTMLEWYHSPGDMFSIMSELEELLHYLDQLFATNFFGEIQKKTMSELWQEYLDLDLNNYLEQNQLLGLVKKLSFKPQDSESYAELFYRVFLNKIEPFLKGPLIVYNYPKALASLSKLDEKGQYAQRFELYYNNLELANAFSELIDSQEQRQRFLQEQKQKYSQNNNLLAIDEEFLKALDYMSETGGIALGVDRLLQVFLGCQNIDDVLVLPMSKLF